MSNSDKRASGLFLQAGKTEKYFCKKFCRPVPQLYLPGAVLCLGNLSEKHVVYKKMRRCLTAIGCLMVFWFFVRTVKFHIFHEPLGEHICWYLYYIPMILIPVLGLSTHCFC